jgi:type IV secretory pathway TrbD component
MDRHQSLPQSLRLRIIVMAVSSGLLLLICVPLAVAVIRSPHHADGAVAFVFGLGVGLPLLAGLAMWWKVRRFRRDPGYRRRRPNGPASQALQGGNLLALVLGIVTQGLVRGWIGWLLGLGVVLVVSFVTFRIAKQRDPRIRYLRRPRRSQEVQEPEDSPPLTPW